jgi:hypothetical protein
MRTKVNTNENIRIGHQVADGDVNLAYINSPDITPAKNVNLISSIYQTNYKEFYASPDGSFELNSDGTTAFNTDSIEITDQFALITNQTEELHPLYYRTKLKKTLDISSMKDKVSPYLTGHMELPATGEYKERVDLVYFGDQVTIGGLSNEDFYKIVLSPTENGREFEYDIWIYTSFRGGAGVNYRVSYKPFGKSCGREEILNLEPFFVKMYNNGTSNDLTSINPPLKVNHTLFDVNNEDILQLIPTIRVSQGNSFMSFRLSEADNVLLPSPNLRIKTIGGESETTQSITIDKTDILSIAEEYNTSGDVNIADLLTLNKYAVEHLTDIDMYRIRVPSRTVTLNNESRPGKLFKYQIDAKLEANYSELNHKTINLGIYFHQGEGIVNVDSLEHLIYNMSAILGTNLPSYISFENPNHPVNSTKENDDYWLIDLYQPLEVLSKYDLIIIAGYGDLDLSYCGSLLEYMKDGGRVWIDNCGNGNEALGIIGWPTESPTNVTFSNLLTSSGTVVLDSNDFVTAYYNLSDSNISLECYVNNVPIAAKVVIPEGEIWTTLAHWTGTGSEAAVAQRHIGTGTLLVSNLGLTRTICGLNQTDLAKQSTSKYTFNLILETIRNLWVRSPKITERIYFTSNIFPIEQSEKIYTIDSINSIDTAKKLLAPSIREFMQAYAPIDLKKTTGTFTIKVYNMDGSECLTVVMPGTNDNSVLTGNEVLWAYLTDSSENQNFDIQELGFVDAETDIYYPDIDFNCSITSCAYDWGGETGYQEITGSSLSFPCTINKNERIKDIVALSNLPARGAGGAWIDPRNTFYKLKLEDEDKNVNLGFYSDHYHYDNSGQAILSWEDIYQEYPNIYKSYNADFKYKITNEFGFPEGWVPSDTTDVQIISVQSDYDKDYLHIKFAPKRNSTVASISKTDYENNWVAVTPHLTYVVSMDIKLISGNPFLLANSVNNVATLALNLKSEFNLVAGEWQTISFELEPSISVLRLKPLAVYSTDSDLECCIANLSVRPKTKMTDIKVCAWTNEYGIRASKRKFAIREVSYKDIKIEYPDTNDLRDPWYLRIHNGKYSADYYADNNVHVAPVKCVYTVPEYHHQVFDPYFPYMRETNGTITFVNASTLQLANNNIVEGSLKLYRRVWENTSIHREKLSTEDKINFKSLHGNWASTPDLKIEILTADFNEVSLEHIIIDYDEGTLQFNQTIQYEVYATYTYSEQEEVSVKDIDTANGVIYTVNDLDFRDDIYAKYIYREEYLEYQGYADENGFHELNLNPLYSKEFYDSNYDNIIIYLLPYMENGNIKEELSYVRHAFTKNFNEILYNYPQAIKLAELKLQANDDIKEATVLDARSRGGGLKEEISKQVINAKLKDSIHFWDLSPWDGIAYQSAGTVVIDLPKSILDQMTEKEVMENIKKYLALGIFPIINYVDDVEAKYIYIINTNDIENLDINGSIELEFGYDSATPVNIQEGLLTLASIKLDDEAINITITNNKLTITPVNALVAGTDYTLIIPTFALCAEADITANTKSEYRLLIHTVSI